MALIHRLVVTRMFNDGLELSLPISIHDLFKVEIVKYNNVKQELDDGAYSFLLSGSTTLIRLTYLDFPSTKKISIEFEKQDDIIKNYWTAHSDRIDTGFFFKFRLLFLHTF